jgi:hypothetical protein
MPEATVVGTAQGLSGTDNVARIANEHEGRRAGLPEHRVEAHPDLPLPVRGVLRVDANGVGTKRQLALW